MPGRTEGGVSLPLAFDCYATKVCDPMPESKPREMPEIQRFVGFGGYSTKFLDLETNLPHDPPHPTVKE